MEVYRKNFCHEDLQCLSNLWINQWGFSHSLYKKTSGSVKAKCECDFLMKQEKNRRKTYFWSASEIGLLTNSSVYHRRRGGRYPSPNTTFQMLHKKAWSPVGFTCLISAMSLWVMSELSIYVKRGVLLQNLSKLRFRVRIMSLRGSRLFFLTKMDEKTILVDGNFSRSSLISSTNALFKFSSSSSCSTSLVPI